MPNNGRQRRRATLECAPWAGQKRAQLKGIKWAAGRGEPLSRSQRPAAGEFQRRQVTQCRVDAFAIVDVIQKAGQLLVGIGEVLIVRQIDLLFFDGADQPFGIRVLFGVLATPFIRAYFRRELAMIHSAGTTKSTTIWSVNGHAKSNHAMG